MGASTAPTVEFSAGAQGRPSRQRRSRKREDRGSRAGQALCIREPPAEASVPGMEVLIARRASIFLVRVATKWPLAIGLSPGDRRSAGIPKP